MKIATRSANLALLALIAAGLLAVPPETQAQEPENFVWVTNTNGLTWKMKIGRQFVHELSFDKSDKPKIASILVPEHVIVNSIDVEGCVNLTNIVIQTDVLGGYNDDQFYETKELNINARNTGLENITCSKTMRHRISLSWYGWWPVQWTELELSKLEIRTHTTANGKEVEIVWRDGKLQIADAVNGEYRDHLGQSPLRFPLAAAKDKQFFRIARIETPTTEEPPTPQTSGGVR